MLDSKLMKICIELAKHKIDIKKIYKDAEKDFIENDKIINLAVKNYNFLEELDNKEEV